MTYSQVWYIIGIVRSSLTHFHWEKIGLIRVTYDPLSVFRVNEYLKWLKLKCATTLESTAQAQISTQKIGLIRVTYLKIEYLCFLSLKFLSTKYKSQDLPWYTIATFFVAFKITLFMHFQTFKLSNFINLAFYAFWFLILAFTMTHSDSSFLEEIMEQRFNLKLP